MAEIGCASVKLGDEVQIKLGDHVVEPDVVMILRDGEWWRIVALRPVDVPDFLRSRLKTQCPSCCPRRHPRLVTMQVEMTRSVMPI